MTICGNMDHLLLIRTSAVLKLHFNKLPQEQHQCMIYKPGQNVVCVMSISGLPVLLVEVIIDNLQEYGQTATDHNLSRIRAFLPEIITRAVRVHHLQAWPKCCMRNEYFWIGIEFGGGHS